METRSRGKREVLPTAPKEEEVKFGSANTWGREQLKLLGVDFYMQRRIDLNRVLGVKESAWSPELRARVEEGARQLAAVEMKDLNNGMVEMDDVSNKLAPKFSATFSSLLTLTEIQEIKERAKALKEASRPSSVSSSAVTVTLKCATEHDPVSAVKRIRTSSAALSPPPEPRTPDRPTHPSNPDFTGTSALSTVSQDEENTKKLLYNLMFNTMTALEGAFRRITWQRSGYKVELCQTERDNTKFLLGVESVNAINDGGLGIRYNAGPGRGLVHWQPAGTVRPVLSLEAKRRRSSKKDDVELIYDYAGQIFCEMLGQTCYKEFYENSEMEYQEAFVIHGSHSSITIYYAKLPNSYLSEISKYGVKYLLRSPLKQRIKLRRTKKFRMRHTAERVELFNILAKLLWYLVSGKSHVGYLYNHDRNPLHTIGQAVYKRIKIEEEPDERMGDVELPDSVTVDTPPPDGSQEIVIESEVEGGRAPSVNSSFSEGTDEDQLLDEGLEKDSLDDKDEIIILEDSD